MICNAGSLQRVKENSSDRARSNVYAFFEHHQIDFSEITGFITRSHNPNHIPLFVSTIVNGLAGSKSDIDVIFIMPPEQSSDRSITSLMFSDARRVGVVLVGENQFSEMMDRIGDDLDSIKLREQSRTKLRLSAFDKAAPLKFSPVQRIVNGMNFAGACPYSDSLEPLCEWIALNSLALAQSTRFIGVLENNLNRYQLRNASNLYALMYLTQAVLAIHGFSHSNPKWTLQHWFERKAECEPNEWWQQFNNRLTRNLKDSLQISNWTCQSEWDDLLAELTDLIGVSVSPPSGFEVISDLDSQLCLPDAKFTQFSNGAGISFAETVGKRLTDPAAPISDLNGQEESCLILSLLRSKSIKFQHEISLEAGVE